MENIEENVVTKGAAKADPMQKLTTGGTPPTYEDLGGPTPENYKPDDDSAKLKVPGGSLKQVKDIVNKGAKPAEGAKGMKEEEAEIEGEVVAEEEQSHRRRINRHRSRCSSSSRRRRTIRRIPREGTYYF